MTTPEIRQRVRDNLNRDDPGIDAKIQGWINDAKRLLEQARNYDYMRKWADLTVSSASPSAPLPANLKSIITVLIRGSSDQVWFDLPRLSDEQALWLVQYSGAAEVGGRPRGYTVDESSIRVWPVPDGPYSLRVVYWAFSDDWTFGSTEEPYLAKFAWPAVIALATALGYEFLGELQDAQAWYQRFAQRAREFSADEAARALEGERTMRVFTGAAPRRPLSSRGLLGV